MDDRPAVTGRPGLVVANLVDDRPAVTGRPGLVVADEKKEKMLHFAEWDFHSTHLEKFANTLCIPQ